MKTDFESRDVARRLLENSRTVAVVGLSDNPIRPSYDVAAYLQNKGFRIIPVNPKIESVLGEKSYPDLSSIPEPIDLVDIFRKSEDVGPIIDEAIQIGARAVWMQLGITNEKAAVRASSAGLDVVMNLCMKMEYQRIHG